MRQRGLAEPVGGGAEARVQPAQGTGYRTRGPGCGWAGPWGERHRLGMVACTRGRGLGSSCVHGQGPGSRKAGKAPSLHLWGGGQLPVPPWGPGPPSGHCRLGGRAIILSPAASPGVSEGGAPERSLEFPGPRCQGPHLAAGCTQREAGLWRGAQARPGHGLPAQGALQRPCGLPWAWARGRLQGEQTSQQTNTLGCCMGVRITKPGGRGGRCPARWGSGRDGKVCATGENVHSPSGYGGNQDRHSPELAMGVGVAVADHTTATWRQKEPYARAERKASRGGALRGGPRGEPAGRRAQLVQRPCGRKKVRKTQGCGLPQRHK